MRRPVVKEEIVDFMRTKQAQNTGFLKELEKFAHKENIPVIPHETVAFFRLLMQTLQPQHILEIGTAIGLEPRLVFLLYSWQRTVRLLKLLPLTAMKK